MLELWVWSLVGTCTRGNRSMFFISMFLSLFLLPILKNKQVKILKKKKKRCLALETDSSWAPDDSGVCQKDNGHSH